jgi:hypothetical protein
VSAFTAASQPSIQAHDGVVVQQDEPAAAEEALDPGGPGAGVVAGAERPAHQALAASIIVDP